MAGKIRAVAGKKRETDKHLKDIAEGELELEKEDSKTSLAYLRLQNENLR